MESRDLASNGWIGGLCPPTTPGLAAGSRSRCSLPLANLRPRRSAQAPLVNIGKVLWGSVHMLQCRSFKTWCNRGQILRFHRLNSLTTISTPPPSQILPNPLQHHPQPLSLTHSQPTTAVHANLQYWELKVPIFRS